MNYILPTLTNIVNEANMQVIAALMRIILERHNLFWFAKSRVGLVILTMFLSRAEMLKQGESTPTATEAETPLPEQELALWSEIYDFMFMSFQGQFPSLFSPETSPADEVYVWQFLSAMAVGASGIDHQKILVTELRENVIQTAKTDHPKALENVNLFLTALGLNITASQLAAMSQ